MFDPVTFRRLQNALKARERAHNPAFKAYWTKVFDQLFLKTE